MKGSFTIIVEGIFLNSTLLQSVSNNHILGLVGGGSCNRPNPTRLFYL